MKPSASVALHKHSNALVDVLPPEADSSITMLSADEKVQILKFNLDFKNKITKEFLSKKMTQRIFFSKNIKKNILKSDIFLKYDRRKCIQIMNIFLQYDPTNLISRK